jgi:hypothetical protein
MLIFTFNLGSKNSKNLPYPANLFLFLSWNPPVLGKFSSTWNSSSCFVSEIFQQIAEILCFWIFFKKWNKPLLTIPKALGNQNWRLWTKANNYTTLVTTTLCSNCEFGSVVAVWQKRHHDLPSPLESTIFHGCYIEWRTA